MTRRSWIILAVILAITAASGLWWFLIGAAVPANRLALAGSVTSDVHTVQAPAIAYPVPDYSVGIPTSQTAPTSAPKRSSGQTMQSQSPTVSGSIESVAVRQGDRVKAGQPIVQLDTTALKLGVAQANAARARARAQVAVLGGSISTVQDNQSKLATAKNQLATASAGLAKGTAALKKAESQFKTQKAVALKKRAELVQLRAILTAQLAALEHSPSPDPSAIAKLKAQIAGINQGIAGIDKGLAAAAAGFAKGNAQIATGAAKLATGKAQLAKGASALSKAKKQLENARNVSRLALASQDAGVTLAEVRLSQATILAPLAGTVTEARTAGTVAMVGAPLVRIRSDEPTKISTYLTGDQLAVVPIGSRAEVTYDSNTGGTLAGRVTRIDSRSQFPPTSFPTNIVHMTQAVRVEVTLDGTGWAPPGTPVDLVIRTTAQR